MPVSGSWARETVERVVQAAKAEVLGIDPNAPQSSPAVKLDSTIGKPEPK
jgi:hypothetical protein